MLLESFLFFLRFLVLHNDIDRIWTPGLKDKEQGTLDNDIMSVSIYDTGGDN